MTVSISDSSATPRPHWLQRPLVIVFGVLPNVPLICLAGLLVLLAFSPSFVYAAGSSPPAVLLMALMLGAPAAGNLLLFSSRRWQLNCWLSWFVVIANAGLILAALVQWKKSFEISSRFFPQSEALLGVIGVSSLTALAWLRLSKSAGLTFTLRELFTVITGIAFFLGIVGWVVRLDQSGRYVRQSPIANHFISLRAGVVWEDWAIAGIHARTRLVTDQDLRRLPELVQLQSLDLSDTKVTDAGMDSIQSLETLEHLYLDGTTISDAGLQRIAGLTKMKSLYLSNTQVADYGMSSLGQMDDLCHLYLGGTAISDRGLQQLSHLRRLCYLHLPGTKVTKEGIDRLHAALPHCRIYGTPGGVDYSVGP